MSAAVTAHDLGALHAERAVRVPRHGARDGVEEGRPAAARLELVARLVEGRFAGSAGVDARGGAVLVVFARVGGFGSLFADYAELFCFFREKRKKTLVMYGLVRWKGWGWGNGPGDKTARHSSSLFCTG